MDGFLEVGGESGRRESGLPPCSYLGNAEQEDIGSQINEERMGACTRTMVLWFCGGIEYLVISRVSIIDRSPTSCPSTLSTVNHLNQPPT